MLIDRTVFWFKALKILILVNLILELLVVTRILMCYGVRVIESEITEVWACYMTPKF
jgi:hypothetical protein